MRHAEVVAEYVQFLILRALADPQGIHPAHFPGLYDFEPVGQYVFTAVAVDYLHIRKSDGSAGVYRHVEFNSRLAPDIGRIHLNSSSGENNAGLVVETVPVYHDYLALFSLGHPGRAYVRYRKRQF